MPKINITLLIFAAIFTLLGCTPEFKPKSVKHVVVIGIDGMSVGGLMEANTPNFDQYIAEGAYSFNTRNVMPTSSGPNWTAMLTGSGVAQTGVTSNDWRYNNYSLPPVVTTKNGRYPDIFYAIKQANPNLKTSSVYHWSGFSNLYDHSHVDLDFDPKTEVLTAKKAAEIIETEKPNYLFVQIDHVDGAGHHSGHMTPGYFKAVELADSLTNIIVESTKKAGIYEETVFMVIADHGGVGYGHGHETVQGNEVPFILFGSGVKKNYKIPVAVNLYDIAATSAFALNVTAPQVWIGRPVECAFEKSPDINPESLMGEFLLPSTYVPVISPRKTNGESGGLFIDKNAVVSIESTGANGKIYYTLDGTIPNRKSMVYDKPFEITTSGVIKAAFFSDAGGQSAFSEGYYRVVKGVNASTGVNYTLYKGKEWTKLPDFSLLQPVHQGKTLEISLDEIEDQIKSYTGVVFEGKIQIDKSGDYSFTTRSDDGSKLYINGKEIVNNDGDHGIQEREGSIYLEKGRHDVKVEYFNGGGGYFLSATYQGPDTPKQILSPNKLTIK